MITVTFSPKKINQKFLSNLPERSQSVLVRRYGLGKDAKKNTLDAIGKEYGVTRERIRQIENSSLKNLKKTEFYKSTEVQSVFNELVDVIKSLGEVIAENELLNSLFENKQDQNNLLLLLVLGDYFIREREDSEFKSRWLVDKKVAKEVLSVLKDLHQNLKETELIPEEEMLSLVTQKIKIKPKDKTNIKRWLALSKVIDKNPFNEWGMATSPDIKVKGIRSHAYLVVKQNGSPMHFREVADMIQRHFNKKVHVATCHNELIKDQRFVLVGRGLYALSEWGYTKGVVKDVIKEILRKEGSLTKNEIIERVLKERYVKGNTVAVNLQNNNFFQKNSDGTYSLLIK